MEAIKFEILGQVFRVQGRWMLRRDLPQLARIEQIILYDDPWDEERLAEALRDRWTIGWVVEAAAVGPGRSISLDRLVVAGFMIYRLRPRSIRILRLTVGAAWRKQGIGSLLIARLVSKLSPRRRRIDVLVNEYNLGGQLFLKRQEFRARRIVRGDDFDSIVFRRSL